MSGLADMDPAGMWEPWTPEKGQRVRVKLSGECRGMYWPLVAGGHEPAMNGKEGRVYATWPDRSGHNYLVILDEPVAVEGFEKPLTHFQLSALEIEPLEGAA